MKVRHFLSALLGVALLLYGTPALAQAQPYFYYQNLIRLQVVARSNSAEDQQVKLGIRDAIRVAAAEIASDAQDSDQAYASLDQSLKDLRSVARDAAEAQGYSGGVDVEMGEFSFPHRVYDGMLVPAGTYRALRVTLGEGLGRNWWCVLYPDLCVNDDLSVQALSNGEEIQFYSSIGRAFARLFGKEEAQ